MKTNLASIEPDFLEPIDCVIVDHFEDYHVALRRGLFANCPDHASLWFLAAPSFEPETLLALAVQEKACELVIVQPKRQLWEEVYKQKSAAVDVPCETVTKAIPKAIADRMERLWFEMLSRARYFVSPVQKLDGIIYRFFLRVKGRGTWAARTHSPSEGSLCGQLAKVGEAALVWARSSDTSEKGLEPLVAAIARLEASLEKAK